MGNIDLLVTMGSAGVAGLTIVMAAALKGFDGWLELKRAELGRKGSAGAPLPVARIDLADMKDRVRKLEAIASGVDY
jgi:hypothetical protein